MSLRDRINAFDFDNAGPHDLAVLLEQVFMYQDTRDRSGGPIIIAQGVLEAYESSVRRRALPESRESTEKHLREMRSTLVQFETTLRGLESATATQNRG